VIETALDEEMSEHLGYDKHEPAGRNRGNSRNGKRSKTVLTDACGDVDIEVPRDRDSTFDPVLVKKRQRRLSDVDEVVLSLYAKGLTTGEISAHFAEVYDASVSKDTVSRITDRVIEEMQAWWSRPLERVYAAVFIDAIMVKVRDGQVGNRPVYAAIGVDLDGHKDILGMWAGDGDGESAKFWMSVLTELRNRGIYDVFFVVCDGLKGLPDSVNAVWPLATVQACIIHLIRGSFRYASRKYWDQLSKDLKPIYTAVNADAALAGLDDLDATWGQRYPAIIRLWRNAWTEFIPFLDYDVHKVICSTNAIESLNARYRGQSAWTLPDRTGRDEMPLPGHPITGPQGDGSDTMGGAVEASPQRVRDHLRRPDAGRGELLMKTPLTPFAGQTLGLGLGRSSA